MSDEGQAGAAFAAVLRSGPDDAALLARDEARAAGTDVVPTLATALEEDGVVRERAAWLAKDLCDPRLWPGLRDALRAAPSRAVLDALERFAFAEVLPADAASAVVSSMPASLAAEMRRPWIALLAALGSDEALARLRSLIEATSLSDRELDSLVGSPDPRVRALVDGGAATARMRAQASLERGAPLPDAVVEDLARAGTWSILARAAQAGALSEDARRRLAAWPEPDGASKSQRRLYRRLRALVE